ncbi:MAG: hypothetical protein A4E49_01820 [Methanosaeta sp. PtaU1.Bin112]|nr:MAG: hypothetical protein A4E49_01820 [Methanosaeta sp. PtaU1.Bin112]
MYDYLIKLGSWAIIALTAICIISSGSQFNGTTYHLGEREALVTVPVNASHLNLTLFEKTENMTLINDAGKNVSFNSSYRFLQGDYIYNLTFADHVTGMLNYTMAVQGQMFIVPIREPVPQRIILPEGFTTGERSLGIARPEPDEFIEDGSRSILIWNNTTEIAYIEVNYYRKSAPQAMAIIMGILGLTGLVLLAQYYMSIRRLRAARMEMEREADGKRR